MDVGNDQITLSEEDQGKRHHWAIGDKDIVTGYRHDSHESPGNIRFTIAENLLQSVGHQRTVLVSWAHSRCYPVWLPQIQSQEFWRLHRICLRRRHCNLTGLLSNIYIFELGLTISDIPVWRWSGMRGLYICSLSSQYECNSIYVSWNISPTN